MKQAKALMVQGTASSVGKSLLVTALCRYYRQKGVGVVPFKAQNMALNSFVTSEGREIGRAQAVQAQAAGVEPLAEMNPILLKCESDHRVQVVVMGKVVRSMSGSDYYAFSKTLRPVVKEALASLQRRYELVLIEGAGSPAEVNLRKKDLANMFPARLSRAPVILVGDIDRGGVFASLAGTLDLLLPGDRSRVKSLVVNKFRGDLKILEPGLRFLERRTGLPVLGVLPFLPDLRVAEEDSTALEPARGSVPIKDRSLRVTILRFPHISNFDDFQPLEHIPGLELSYISNPLEMQEADLVILPGTKTTMADLKWLRSRGFEEPLRARALEGKPILGVCGGYQMLGKRIEDPHEVESQETKVRGLGLLPVVTRFEKGKVTARTEAILSAANGFTGGSQGRKISAYEIHHGRVRLERPSCAWFEVVSRYGRKVREKEGAVSGAVCGTLLHGLFENELLRSTLVSHLARNKGLEMAVEPFAWDKEYDRLADWVRKNLDTALLDRLIGWKP